MRLFSNILTPTGIAAGSTLETDEIGRIIAVIAGSSSLADYNYAEALVVPGFVDLHVHGAGGSDFMDGTAQAVRTVARTHARHGTTSLLATTLTADLASIDRAIEAIVEVMDDPRPDEAAILGIHLEGPYICSKRRGAQPAAPIRPPDADELSHWIELSRRRIKQVTLAPEVAGALPFIEFAVRHGVTVSIGHTDASFKDANAAIGAGARLGTHLFNAMSALGHRSPGVVGALLASDAVYCELICDGRHVDESVVKIAVRAKGEDRIVLITDAMSGAAMPDGRYSLGGTAVVVDDGTASFEDGTLAGSVLTMETAFRNVRLWTQSDELAASRMASMNAATVLGLDRDLGSIEPGKYADLAVLDPANGTVIAAFKSGRLIAAN